MVGIGRLDRIATLKCIKIENKIYDKIQPTNISAVFVRIVYSYRVE